MIICIQTRKHEVRAVAGTDAEMLRVTFFFFLSNREYLQYYIYIYIYFFFFFAETESIAICKINEL